MELEKMRYTDLKSLRSDLFDLWTHWKSDCSFTGRKADSEKAQKYKQRWDEVGSEIEKYTD